MYNLKNGRSITNEDKLYKEYIKCFEKDGEGYENTVLLEKLIKLGFLIEEYVDEEALLRYQANRNIYSDEVLELTLLMTDACNFQCQYCYQKEHTHFMSEQVFDKLMRFMENAVRKYRVIHIDWFGGEPLLAIEITLKFMEKILIIINIHLTVKAKEKK